ncbi:hypothetical protein MKX01_010963 [Papaver californicum]|nr:hypothetical protein MKX01_010963 [Papaver californicum]
MMIQTLTRIKLILRNSNTKFISTRFKTTSAEYVASRARDPTFDKLMKNYKNYLKVVSVQDLLLADTTNNSSISLAFLSKLSQRLHLNHGASSFLRKYPHIFNLFYNRSKSEPFCKLTDKALQISREEAAAIEASKPIAIERLVRILSMSVSNSLPLRAVFKVWRELGLPDDFEESVISQNPNLFSLSDAPNEPNTHILKLESINPNFITAVENWRVDECNKKDSKVYESQIRFAFKQGYPPRMKLGKIFREKVKEWQALSYVGPYDQMGVKRKSKAGIKELEKRAVGIVHEFLSLTVEKMIEVEKISHFRKWFGIDLNIRDLFLDHPGIFYLSTKGKTHTVFLREAYERGCLIEPNPVYSARRKLLDLVIMSRRGLFLTELDTRNIRVREEVELTEDDDD